MAKEESLKVIKKLNQYLNHWLKSHGFDCTVRYTNDFGYEPLNEIIDYSFLILEQHDELFFNFCKELQPSLISCDNFILSFFHELGHHITDDDFSDEEYTDYLMLVTKMNDQDNFTTEDCLNYYNHPVEYEATKWACQYIIDNYEEVKDFYIQVQKFELEYLEAIARGDSIETT